MLPQRKGVYILYLCLTRPCTVKTARGVVELEPGLYAYVGSAGGPGGLAARVLRHLRREKKLRWHIDYLTTAEGVKPVGVSYCVGDYGVAAEARVAEALAELFEPVPGFGATDDPFSRTHLFKLSRYCSDREALSKAFEELARRCRERAETVWL